MEVAEDHSNTDILVEEFPVITKTSVFFSQYKLDSEAFMYSNPSTLNAYDESSMKTLLTKTSWSAEEDFRLRSAVCDAKDGTTINWESVMQQMPGRSAQELLAKFFILESTKDAWTLEEDQQLLDLINKHGKNNWAELALELGGNRRTPFQCLQRYQKELRSDRLFTLPWTKEEDLLLKLGIERYGHYNYQAIASHIPGRTANQCRYRVRKSLEVNEHLVSGRWTEDEQRHLFLAALAYNIVPLSATKRTAEDLAALLDGTLEPNAIADKFVPEMRGWAAASKLVPGKSDVQCREKWSNNLDPTINFAAYTDEEDEVIEKLVGIFGEKSWTKIASFLPGRTDYTVRRRWMNLHGISPLLQHRKDSSGLSPRKQKPRKKATKRKASDSDFEEDSEEDEVDEDYMDES